MEAQNIDVSVVVPLLNEAESLPELVDWIAKVFTEEKINGEVYLIDDGSTDESWNVILALKQKYNWVHGIQFLRNYGKSAALQVGFQEVKGNVVITMDADLQDSPDEIPGLRKMIIEDGYDLVSGWKEKRYDPITKTIPTKLFNAATRAVSGIHLNDFNCGLKAYKKDVVKIIEVYGEMHRYIPVIAKWNGFAKIGEKPVQHRARKYGTTKFGLERFVNGFLDLMSITFVSKFKKAPMHFFGLLGSISFLLGSAGAFWLLIEKVYLSMNHLHIQREVTDQPLFYLSLTAVIIGSQMFMTGFIAEMVSLNQPNRNDYHIKGKTD
ncbi:glycosyltransferase family 2 protein [Flammeovirga kamogawensis]|uniref:Glycosyltransferase family 2 protein n=1 Tax=Flammeovirga kamogawensis TaxID=373891 RepID=A0ABX8GS10_9BACT|nr:glycosyltransferase family 2 protein [Flammeovirga kamogawensis]MBB6461436.1 glycosyltransferase involved in cell wall biosynthesis [Flammeovirga kamogawensis]QWG06331.1 glycosyltransferase family 2 protein [Flammeovirga kamogawensis]TRX68159.1 glycosyltransferase family 2 protein [Flammeovirga kamogawensis]